MTKFASRLLAATVQLSAASSAALAADQTKTLGKFGDWSAFAYADKASKICYAVAKPARSMNAPKGRGDVYVTITHRPNDKSFDVVSVTQGYSFKKDSVPEMDVSGARFDLYTQDSTAWSRTDKAIVQAMLKSKQVIVHGQPVKGEASADTYALDGFAKAYAEIGKACGK